MPGKLQRKRGGALLFVSKSFKVKSFLWSDIDGLQIIIVLHYQVTRVNQGDLETGERGRKAGNVETSLADN